MVARFMGVASDFGDNIYVQVSTEDAPPDRWHVHTKRALYSEV